MLKYFRITVLALLIGWMILIFCLSSQTAEASSETSGETVSIIINLFIPGFDELPETEQLKIMENFQFIVRKTAHFAIFAILGGLSFLNVVTYKNIAFKFRFILSSLFCLVYAVSDELHQLIVPGRSGEIRDVLIDFGGALIGIAFLSLIVKISKFKFIKKYT